METLSTAEWMRRRAGWFIGRKGDGSTPNEGIYTLLKEMINNAVDEFLKGHGNVIDIVLTKKRLQFVTMVPVALWTWPRLMRTG